MRTKILTVFLAGGLLVGAGFLTSVISAPDTAQAQEETGEGDDGSASLTRIFGFLGDVLDELVGDGTITQDQADAIVEASQDKAEGLKAERLELRMLFSEFLEDGVITEEEASELPAEHWIFGDGFQEAWEDGELTREEIQEARPHPRRGAFKKGFRFGTLLDDGGIDEDEYGSLGENHPLKRVDVDEYLDDGLITPEELREIFHELGESRFGDDA